MILNDFLDLLNDRQYIEILSEDDEVLASENTVSFNRLFALNTDELNSEVVHICPYTTMDDTLSLVIAIR